MRSRRTWGQGDQLSDTGHTGVSPQNADRRQTSNRVVVQAAAAQLFLLFAVIYSVLAPPAAGLNNGLARVPQMGFNSWNFFRCNINESVIREVADAMVASGLRDAGYKYVVIDDCWQEKRGPDGRIQPFKSKFPSGMKALADYVHSKGLLFGLYSDTGNKTCEGYPGSWGYEALDAKTYAEWGVDYLKYDYCGMDQAHEPVETSYARMRDALLSTGRPILYSLCSWGAGSPWQWGHKVGNSWRTGIDVFAVWDDAQAASLKLPTFLQPILRAVSVVEPLHSYAGPGGFNDPDMLVVGLDGMYPYGIVKECPPHVVGCRPGEYISRERWGKVGGLSFTEQRTHFALWCMLASPLILGNDPRQMSKATLSILTAPELVAINQDSLGKQAVKVWQQGDLSVWVKQLSGGRYAALLFNAGNSATDITLQYARDLPEAARTWAREVPGADPVCEDKLPGCKEWAKHGECERNPGYMLEQCKASCPAGCPHPLGPLGPKATAMVRDAWQQDDLGPHVAQFKAHLVEPHEARVVVLRFVEPAEAAAWKPQLPHISQVTAHSREAMEAAAAVEQGNVPERPSLARKEAAGAASTLATANAAKDVKRLKDQVAAYQESVNELNMRKDVCEEQLSTCKRQNRQGRGGGYQPADDGGGVVVAGAGNQASQAWLTYLLICSNLMFVSLLAFVGLRNRRGNRSRKVPHRYD